MGPESNVIGSAEMITGSLSTLYYVYGKGESPCPSKFNLRIAVGVKLKKEWSLLMHITKSLPKEFKRLDTYLRKVPQNNPHNSKYEELVHL